MSECDEVFELVMSANISELRKALTSGANPNCRDKDNRSPLHWASQEGHAEIARCLVKAGADVESKDNLGFTPLAIAASEGHIETVAELLKNGAVPNTKISSNEDGSALHLACSWGHLEIVKMLSEVSGVDLNQKDSEGRTPLFFSKDGGFTSISNYLIQKGAE